MLDNQTIQLSDPNRKHTKYDCVLCGKETEGNLLYYIDGAGQLCARCYTKIYST